LYKNKHRYDAVHACDFDTAFISSIIAFKFNKKFIYDIFDYYVDSYNVPKVMKKYIERIDKAIINKSQAVIICSEKRIEQINGTNPKQLVIIHNTPANLKNEVSKLILNESKIKIVYVGILGCDRFIKEITEVIKEKPEYEFHVGGFGLLEDYLINMSKKHNNIIFYGKLPYKKTLELESSCDIMTAIYNPEVPNHYYAAPNKFYEAFKKF
jgi:ribosomal protein L30E